MSSQNRNVHVFVFLRDPRLTNWRLPVGEIRRTVDDLQRVVAEPAADQLNRRSLPARHAAVRTDHSGLPGIHPRIEKQISINLLTERSKYSIFPTMRGPEKQFNREEVLGKAMELFWNQGYAATGMSQLLSHMGIGRQSLYDTFGDKKSLYLAALERYFAFVGDQWKLELDAPGSPMGKLKGLFQRMLVVAEQTGFCGCFIGNAMAEFGDDDEDVRRILGKALDRMETMLAGVLEQAKEVGELSPQARPCDLAKLLVVVTQGSALMSRLEPSRKHAEESLQIAFRVLETS